MKRMLSFVSHATFLVDRLLIVMVNAFIKKEFNTLKKVNSEEKNCPLLNYIGNKQTSQSCVGLLSRPQYIK
jgi:hypothetical protein